MLIEFTGLARSGNHAVLHWMLHDMGASGKTVVWYNMSSEHGVHVMLPGSVVIHSYEDCKPRGLSIVRDPYNYWASRYQKSRDTGTFVDHMRQRKMWKWYAHRAIVEPHKCVVFNRWATDQSYRDELATRLGFVRHDLVFDKMAIENGGSSFGDLDVLNRWRKLRQNQHYQSFFDDEVRALARQLFPEMVVDV